MHLVLVLIVAVLATGLGGVSAGAQIEPRSRDEVIAGDVEVEITVLPADGQYLMVWLAPGYGARDKQLAFGAALAAEGVEVWMADLIDAFFLPRDRNAQLRIDPQAVAELVTVAHRRSGKTVMLMASGSAAIAALRGARAWQAGAAQETDPQRYLGGAILLSPSLYRGVPRLGAEPRYLPIVGATRIPVMVFQPGRRIGGQRLPALTAALSGGGAQVYAQLMPNVGNLFGEDPPSPRAGAAIDELPSRVVRMLPLLAQTDFAIEPAALADASVTRRPGLDRSLKAFAGRPMAEVISLNDTNGRPWRIDDYAGRVTLINFWASWCPPCVKEIPSLSRLQQALSGSPFRLISVDFGESPAVIADFLQHVEVDFPVLLDVDGTVAKAWRVIGLPSTFVVGPDGRIHYGANGALAWDSPAVVEQLRALGDDPR